jgi:hypothetical protein
MRRVALLLSAVVVVLLVSAVVVSRPPAVAHEATPTGIGELATHPVVGVWDSTGELDGDTFRFLAIFHADGTYMEIYPWGAILNGVWQPTGARTAEATAVNYFLVDDRLVRGEGRFTAEVDETGDTISTDGTFVSRFEDGSIEFVAGGPSPGTRLEVLPVLPLEELTGTPVAATPAS